MYSNHTIYPDSILTISVAGWASLARDTIDQYYCCTNEPGLEGTGYYNKTAE